MVSITCKVIVIFDGSLAYSNSLPIERVAVRDGGAAGASIVDGNVRRSSINISSSGGMDSSPPARPKTTGAITPRPFSAPRPGRKSRPRSIQGAPFSWNNKAETLLEDDAIQVMHCTLTLSSRLCLPPACPCPLSPSSPSATPQAAPLCQRRYQNLRHFVITGKIVKKIGHRRVSN